jgi:hypothetical protein
MLVQGHSVSSSHPTNRAPPACDPNVTAGLRADLIALPTDVVVPHREQPILQPHPSRPSEHVSARTARSPAWLMLSPWFRTIST